MTVGLATWINAQIGAADVFVAAVWAPIYYREDLQPGRIKVDIWNSTWESRAISRRGNMDNRTTVAIQWMEPLAETDNEIEIQRIRADEELGVACESLMQEDLGGVIGGPETFKALAYRMPVVYDVNDERELRLLRIFAEVDFNVTTKRP